MSIAIDKLEFGYPQGDFRMHVDELRVQSGAKVAVIGPSGSGKTTLLHLVAGIHPTARGRIEVEGTEVSALATSLARKHNTWLLGPGSTGYASAMGPDLTVAPREIVCRLQGDQVAIEIEGNARPLSASYAIEVAGEEIDKAFRGQRLIPGAQ